MPWCLSSICYSSYCSGEVAPASAKNDGTQQFVLAYCKTLAKHGGGVTRPRARLSRVRALFDVGVFVVAAAAPGAAFCPSSRPRSTGPARIRGVVVISRIFVVVGGSTPRPIRLEGPVVRSPTHAARRGTSRIALNSSETRCAFVRRTVPSASTPEQVGAEAGLERLHSRAPARPRCARAQAPLRHDHRPGCL